MSIASGHQHEEVRGQEDLRALEHQEDNDEDEDDGIVTQQSARDLFERVQSRNWPAMPTFTFGGVLGGASGIGGLDPASTDAETDPWWRSVGRNPGARRAWMVFAGVAAAIFVAVAISGGGSSEEPEGDKSPLSAGNAAHRTDATGEHSAPLSALRKRLQGVADAATAAGITLPMHTTFEVVRAGDDEGMDFIVSVIKSDALEAKAATATPPSTAASQDPFDARVLDSRMIVADLPPAHSLVLNKFNTVRDHGLIITKDFQSQEEALTEADFRAWYGVVKDLPAVGFYNSAVEAGASQRHKHMQVIPDDALWAYRPEANEAIPVDEPIARLVGDSRNFDRVGRVPGFDFEHAFTLLPTAEELAGMKGEAGRDAEGSVGMAAYLRSRFEVLLAEVGFDTSALHRQDSDGTAAVPQSSLPPYNAILTTRWLMVVPRSAREWGGVDVNGMGFFGALLVREKAFAGEGAGVEAVRGPGATKVLEGVTFRSSS